LESLKQRAAVESSESSNRLEGIIAPHNRVEALVLKSTNPKNRPEQEIAGYRDALYLIHESAAYMDFSKNVILQLHQYINRYLSDPGGHWKMADNEITEKDSAGRIIRVRFVPVNTVRTPFAMDELVKNYQSAIQQHKKDPLLVIPLAVLDFLCIHPFSDGNGRVSRLLTLMLLYHFGYEVGRYISLERIFEETKETYYESLEASSKDWHKGKHDVFPWVNYFWGVMLRAYREFEDRVGTIKVGKGSKTDLIREAVKHRIKPFAISDIESDCPGISRDMVRVVLRQLKEEGVIKAQGKGRGAKWLRRSS
jgi:Fic family protein